MRLYAVTKPGWPEDERTIIVQAREREQAKRTARPELGGDADKYIVEPLPVPPAGATSAKILWKAPKNA